MPDSPFLVLSTPEIRRQLHVSLHRPQTSILIVTPFLEDYDFGSNVSLGRLLSAQLGGLATVELLTTPPASKASEFRRKYMVLEQYSNLGIQVGVNDLLHAKAFCFNFEGREFVTLVGSANLTSGGMQELLELGVLSARPGFYHSVMAHLRSYLSHGNTRSWYEWKVKERIKIAEKLREAQHDR